MKQENLNNTPTHLCSPFLINFNTLKFNPILTQLLKDYVCSLYEENAKYDDESLLNEYKYLLENNRLYELFEWEFLQNTLLNNN